MAEIDNKKSLMRLRNFLGFMGMILPFVALLGGFLVQDKSERWWYSISATYHITPALAVILGSCAFFFLCYRSYDKIDTMVNSLSGAFALGVVLFPCADCAVSQKIGFFQLDKSVSNIIHCSCALLLFVSLGANILFLFSKGKSEKRNIIYRLSGHAMFIIMLTWGVGKIISLWPDWATIIFETVLLLIFGFAWLVKGRAILRGLD